MELYSPTTPAGAALNLSRNERLTEILLMALGKLAAAGDIETACRLAGEACAALRREDAEAERRFNAFLHRMCKRLSW